MCVLWVSYVFSPLNAFHKSSYKPLKIPPKPLKHVPQTSQTISHKYPQDLPKPAKDIADK